MKNADESVDGVISLPNDMMFPVGGGDNDGMGGVVSIRDAHKHLYEIVLKEVVNGDHNGVVVDGPTGVGKVIDKLC